MRITESFHFHPFHPPQYNEPPLFHTAPEPAVSQAARLAEAARRELLTRSEHVRLGRDPHPKRTARALSHAALNLATSPAPSFEIASAITAAEANLLAGGVSPDDVQIIDELAVNALHTAHPPATDTYIRTLNEDEITAHLAAIRSTTPKQSFLQALERARENLGRPLDPLIVTTEEENNKKYINRPTESERTGAASFDPFDDDEKAA